MDSQRSSRRGFAGMDQGKQREIASKGGQAAHKKGTAHEFTSDEARAAGRKGGETVSANRVHMSAIGRKGGESSHTGQKSAQNKVAPDSQRVESDTQNGDQPSDAGSYRSE
ncbi:MAG: KGG domain-containing protein [Candidatus Binatus sp.]|uniref:KGG domain-containing protein n=1 Tax=Candidatus Binatus sp. TaxID=2811406 RepID=UPI002726AF47|nr:KGG domain-containing protein [Candidatus Binatus sp.]MDO8430775.1 KGG domain-containing protein [Candidatus Binatus sp.]